MHQDGVLARIANFGAVQATVVPLLADIAGDELHARLEVGSSPRIPGRGSLKVQEELGAALMDREGNLEESGWSAGCSTEDVSALWKGQNVQRERPLEMPQLDGHQLSSPRRVAVRALSERRFDAYDASFGLAHTLPEACEEAERLLNTIAACAPPSPKPHCEICWRCRSAYCCVFVARPRPQDGFSALPINQHGPIARISLQVFPAVFPWAAGHAAPLNVQTCFVLSELSPEDRKGSWDYSIPTAETRGLFQCLRGTEESQVEALYKEGEARWQAGREAEEVFGPTESAGRRVQSCWSQRRCTAARRRIAALDCPSAWAGCPGSFG